MKRNLPRLTPVFVILAFCLVPTMALAGDAHRQLAQLQQPFPAQQGTMPQQQPQQFPAQQGNVQQQQPPQFPAQQGNLQQQPQVPPQRVSPDLRGYWSQQGGLYYLMVVKPGQWPVPHTHEMVLVRKDSAWLVPMNEGTVCCVFNLQPGATSAQGMMLAINPGQGVHWTKARVNVLGPSQLSMQPTDLPVPPIDLTRIQSLD
ncbi:MAG: hypothetical protein KQJ78_24515 [Deltaproteobacteria bacterium]|nr:hypothetical protein [Deltaproteobacteria bacterium]